MRVVNLTIGVSGSTLVKRVVIRFRHDRSVFLVIERGKCLIGARFRELWPLQLVEALSDSEAGGPLPECTGQVVVKLNLGHSTNRFEARSLREGVLLLRRGKINAFVSQG